MLCTLCLYCYRRVESLRKCFWHKIYACCFLDFCFDNYRINKIQRTIFTFLVLPPILEMTLIDFRYFAAPCRTKTRYFLPHFPPSLFDRNVTCCNPPANMSALLPCPGKMNNRKHGQKSCKLRRFQCHKPR